MPTLIDKLKSMFAPANTQVDEHEMAGFVEPLVRVFRDGAYAERGDAKKKLADALKLRDAEFKLAFTVYGLNRLATKTNANGSWPEHWAIAELLSTLYRSTIPTTEVHFATLLLTFREVVPKLTNPFYYVPIVPVFRQLEKFAAKHPLSPELKQLVQDLIETGEFTTQYQSDHNAKDIDTISAILRKLTRDETDAAAFTPVELDESDSFGRAVNDITRRAEPEQQNALYGLIAHFKKATGAKPSTRYLQEITALTALFGDPARYTGFAKQWLTSLRQVAVQTETHTHAYENGHQYTYTSNTFLNELNAVVVKGFVWSLLTLTEKDAELLTLLNAVVEKCYQKIPGKGPAAASVGNAGLYVLANEGLVGVGYLSRLKLRIKQASTQELIENYIQEASVRANVSPEEIEDMAVSDHGLTDGKLVRTFGDYTVELSLISVGKIDWQWTRADGTVLKSEPAAVKKEWATDLKSLKQTAIDIQKNSTAQRDRLDRTLILNRSWSWARFSEHYLQHGLMNYLTKRLIWTFSTGEQTADVFFGPEGWVDATGTPIGGITTETTVRLWHPIGKTVDQVLAWREFLATRQVRQPVKQAYREVYLLTVAEVTTRNYSNRMAAHILKQHQFNTLAKGRGWKYSLLGAYDKGYESEKARLALPAYDLKAEFWVSEVYADGAWNDTGIYLYVSTDQVRFTRLNDEQPLNLIDIPALVLSEVMRDVDLFVGVGSVGSDPNWRDNGGLLQFRDYWQSFSFGELGELAKTRKQVLEKLVPRLKIAQVAELRDRFLVVRGKLRTYKIHLGSGNILMEPNDQYLCIVADRSVDKMATNVFLPFEGDTLLSVILSKAFLLADDDKITDETITRQLTV